MVFVFSDKKAGATEIGDEDEKRKERILWYKFCFMMVLNGISLRTQLN